MLQNCIIKLQPMQEHACRKFSSILQIGSIHSNCREPTMEYNKHINILAETLFELLSEALGLQPDHLNSMGCNKGCSIVSHYYPPCPEPELTLGLRKHADAGIMALLLQNHVTGLQVLHDDRWFNVHPARGGLIVNIGDLFQVSFNSHQTCIKLSRQMSY